MKAVSDDYLRCLGGLKSAEPHASVRFFSSVTGKEKRTEFGASYWVENLVSKVRYSDALQTMCKILWGEKQATAQHVLIELGPHSRFF
jgi:acyl transferase domain-containing protein